MGVWEGPGLWSSSGSWRLSSGAGLECTLGQVSTPGPSSRGRPSQPRGPWLLSPPGSRPSSLVGSLDCGGWRRKGSLVPAALLWLEQERDKGPILELLSVSMSLVAEPPGGKAFEVFPWEMVANKSAAGWYSS